MATQLKTGLARFSYLAVFEPKAIEQGGDLKYSAVILIPKKDKETYNKILDAIDEAIEKKFGKSINPDKLPKNFKYPLKDGDEDFDHDNYAGFWVISSYANNKPGIVDRNGNPIHDDYDKVYSGCWGRASVNFYGFDYKSKGVAVGLNNLQKLKDDDRLDGRKSAIDDFDDDFDFDDDDDYSDRKKPKGRSTRDDDEDDRRSSKGSSRKSSRDDDDDEDDRRSSRRSTRDDDDDEDDYIDRKSVRKSSRDDDDEDDYIDRKSVRKSSRDDDDEDDRPRRRR